jgi:hypothetical protein
MKIGFASRYDPRDKKPGRVLVSLRCSNYKNQVMLKFFNTRFPSGCRNGIPRKKALTAAGLKNTATEFLTSYAKYFSRKLSADLKKDR